MSKTKFVEFPKDVKKIEKLIKETMEIVESLPMGGIGERGPTQAELDAALKEGHVFDFDATFHSGQQIWLNMRAVLQELEAVAAGTA